MTTGTPPRADVILAAVLATITVLEVTLNPAVTPKAGALLCQLVIAAAVGFRRSGPLLACLLIAVGSLAESAVGVPVDEPIVPLFSVLIVAYSVVSYAPLREAAVGLLVIVLGAIVGVGVTDAEIDNLVFGLAFLAAFGLMGATVRRRTSEAAALSRAAALSERALAEESERAKEQERTRIAREIHDVVAHSLTVMIVQAGAAEKVLDADPEQALASLRTVQTTGRSALGEMSALLGVLRSGGEEIGLTPQPGIDRVRDLVDEARGSGLPVELVVRGEERELPDGIALTVYRIVQEALTNTRKHSGDVPIRVELGYLPASIDVNVVDDGDGRRDAHHGGHGLLGMRERVEMYAGSMAAGPEPGGGFAVRVSIPSPGPA